MNSFGSKEPNLNVVPHPCKETHIFTVDHFNVHNLTGISLNSELTSDVYFLDTVCVLIRVDLRFRITRARYSTVY